MSANNQPPLAERSDIHKSCKSIENLLSVFNDYCEALGAIAVLQKKLSKALRETAGMKVTGEIAANALNASATIFESLNEVDSKFSKLADKEYDAISEEVKKWFKKLMKEEKAHDERIVAANNKIKQAGQIYEKKAKKGPREANEEHVRYINLISAIGPEISQEKYNHSFMVSQRHTSTTYNIAACVSRIADAEWMKACEGVRRFSPTIGKLGEWRALCEGGWTGSVPQDLPDIESPRESVDRSRPDQDDRSQPQGTIKGTKSEPEQIHQDAAGNHTGTSTPTFESLAEGPFGQQSPQRQYSGHNDSPGVGGIKTSGQSAPPTSFNLSNKYQDDTTGSVRSLSAFPSPPTHYPLPPSMTQRQQQSSQSTSHSSSTSHIAFPSSNRTPDLLRPSEATEEFAAQSQSPGISPGTSPSASPVRVKFQDRPQVPAEIVEESVSDVKSSPQISSRPKPVRAETLDPSTHRNAEPVDMPSPSIPERGNYLPEEPTTPPTPSHKTNPSLDGGRPNKLERTDTGTSSGSMVAAMRNRYSFNSGSSSPPPARDIPRLPQSVSNLASKYDRPVSPPSGRPLPSIDIAARQSREISYREREREREREPTVTPNYRSTSNPVSIPSADEDLVARRRHQQRMDPMAEMELKEKEQELKRRELDIEERARELEQERANLLQTVNASSGLDISLPPRQRQLSSSKDPSRRPYSAYGDVVASPISTGPVSPRLEGTAPLRPHSYYSTSATHLVPPASPSSRYPYRSGDEEFMSERTSNSRDPSVTSVTSGSMTSSPPMPSTRTEKKGWMRRLSMPIVAGNAFLEGKKHSSNNSFGGKAGLLSFDSRKNGSNAYLKGGTVGEDGRLSGGLMSPKNYELGSGVSNRSVTNLNGRR